jgi:hypothetical protein
LSCLVRPSAVKSPLLSCMSIRHRVSPPSSCSTWPGQKVPSTSSTVTDSESALCCVLVVVSNLCLGERSP